MPTRPKKAATPSKNSASMRTAGSLGLLGAVGTGTGTGTDARPGTVEVAVSVAVGAGVIDRQGVGMVKVPYRSFRTDRGQPLEVVVYRGRCGEPLEGVGVPGVVAGRDRLAPRHPEGHEGEEQGAVAGVG